MPTTQSAHRIAHSIEIAVTASYSDLLMAADSGQISALCILDLTAAFDTVDHELLILPLERQSGVICIVCSVPQGSVLDPRLFVLYTAELPYKADEHGVKLHAFADDTQSVCTMYIDCKSTSWASVDGWR